jgi:hypothetical protein
MILRHANIGGAPMTSREFCLTHGRARVERDRTAGDQGLRQSGGLTPLVGETQKKIAQLICRKTVKQVDQRVTQRRITMEPEKEPPAKLPWNAPVVRDYGRIADLTRVTASKPPGVGSG